MPFSITINLRYVMLKHLGYLRNDTQLSFKQEQI